MSTNSESNTDTDSDVETVQNIVAINNIMAQSFVPQRQMHDVSFTGYNWVHSILHGHPERCQRNFRMKRLCFISLCTRLESYGLRPTPEICVREMVAIFLYSIALNLPTRQVAERFQRSNSTICVYFHSVLDVVLALSNDIITPEDPTFNSVPEEIRSDGRYYPYFRNCIGAIDGTHIKAHLPSRSVAPFIGRKGYATQNVMAVCSFNLTFTFVRAGWEGTAHDSRVLQSVLNDRSISFPHPPQGQYYLVDSGYALAEGYLPPYRSCRYHIPDFRGTQNQRKSANEIFNFYHSSLRMAVERTFGIWKKKFTILSNMPTYDFKTQVKVVVATMAIHNFIRRYNSGDSDFMPYDDNPELIPDEYIEEYEDIRSSGEGNEEHAVRNVHNAMGVVRDTIRNELVAAGFR